MSPEGSLNETSYLPPLSLQPLPARYENLGELGRGGMGIVYKARDRETGELLAVKVLKPEVAANTQIIERFKNELLLAHQITHRNVARLYEFHRSGDAVLLSMEYVEGESLRSLMDREGKLPVPRVLDLARQLGAGLGEAHRQSIAHRDLKPENIMLTPQGELKVMDFGISRSYATDVTATGLVIGTPAYMAPEQAEGKLVDHRTDIYAVGLILYEMVTGKAAFTGDTAVTLALKQIRERPKPPRQIDPNLPKHVEAAILRCLEKDPAARFQSVHDLIQALQGAPAAPRRKMPKSRLALAAVIVAVAAAGAYWWLTRDTDSVRMPLETFTLANGLRVVLSPDHSSPSLTVAVAYRAGERYEPLGHEGVAHLTEHAMFQGSANVAQGELVTTVSNAGGNINALTGSDTSWYSDQLPANQLEMGLFLEADRMRGLELTADGLATARGVFLQERNAFIGQPTNKYSARLVELSFDNVVNQRLGWNTPEEAGRITVDDINQYHRAYFTPRNAAIALVGEFDAAKARPLIRKYFESIPSGAAPQVPDVREPKRTAEKRETVTDAAIQFPTLFISWRMPARTDPDWFPALRLADALGADEASRLNTSLVKNAAVSSGVSVTIDNSAGPNLLEVAAYVASGKDPAQVEQLIDSEIERIAREGLPAPELQRLVTDERRQHAFDLVGTRSRAAAIAAWVAVYGAPDGLNEWEHRNSRVSSDDVRRVAQKYFAPSNRTVLLVMPAAGVAR
ncbi:MAG TPA: protein kinase [Candidatus Limnocylindrales bacterium]|nr:protein kinase [Candidatus Limnocylindrales bacterium]